MEKSPKATIHWVPLGKEGEMVERKELSMTFSCLLFERFVIQSLVVGFLKCVLLDHFFLEGSGRCLESSPNALQQ
jgi:hypothetical protein